MAHMILVTGGTGFIGQALIRRLAEFDMEVRTLIRPSQTSPSLPKGVPIDVAVAGLDDLRGLRAALVGVDTVYHLIGGEWKGARADLMRIDILGTQNVLRACQDAKIERFFYLSHLGADRASAYPVFKAKAIAEEYIRRSGLDFTILRTAMVFGAGDGFTTGLAQLLHAPLPLLVPGEGASLLQPIWVEDLATCLVWALDDVATKRRVFEVGGPEYLTFRQIIEIIQHKLNTHHSLVGVSPAMLKRLTIMLEDLFPGLPVSQYWVDYLTVNRTCALDTLPREFHLMPSRFSHRLDYLTLTDWGKEFRRNLSPRRKRKTPAKPKDQRGKQ